MSISSIQHVTTFHGHNSFDGRSPLAAEGWAGGDRFGSETQGVALHWCVQGTPEINIQGIIFTVYIYVYTIIYISIDYILILYIMVENQILD